MRNLSKRQEAILLLLKKLDFLNRDQIRKIHRLGSIRNTNRVLKELSPYLYNFREEYSTIYYLNKDGREYVNSQKVRKKNSFVNHVIMRNDFYIYSGYPVEWKNEMSIKDSKHSVICDSLFKKNGMYHYLEVDSLQKMSENKSKIKQYKGFFQLGELANHFGYVPKLIWLTTTELRRKQLIELCNDFPCEIYTTEDIK